MDKVILCLLLLTGCGYYEGIPELTQHGSYEDGEFGTFTATVYFDDEYEQQQTPEDIARIAVISLRALRDMGNEKGIEDYTRSWDMLPCVADAKVRITSKENLRELCGRRANACNEETPLGNTMYLANDISYSCLNTRVIGHEFLHGLLSCIGMPVIGYPPSHDHSAPHVFARGPDNGPQIWNNDTVEHLIQINPATSCLSTR